MEAGRSSGRSRRKVCQRVLAETSTRLRAVAWTWVEPERSYLVAVVLQLVDDFAIPGAVFTDGSFPSAKGSAAWMAEDERVATAQVPHTRSSTLVLYAIVYCINYNLRELSCFPPWHSVAEAFLISWFANQNHRYFC
jgi:hypothetical protein